MEKFFGIIKNGPMAVSLLSAVILITGCSHLFYHPNSHMYVDLKKVSPSPEVIKFQNKDGQKLVGWYFKSPIKKSKAKILFFHGNAENISSHFLALHWVVEKGYDFFIFDYPGYGASEGEPTQKSTTESGLAALDWLNKKDPQIPLVIFGQSLGGNIAMHTTVTRPSSIPICLVAVESTFKSYKKVAQRVLSNHWFTWPLQWVPYLVIRDSYSAQNLIDKISPTPLLVIHGDADPIVTIANGRDVFEAAKDPKEFWPVPNGQHIRAFWGPQGTEIRSRFLEKIDRECLSQK